MTAMIENTLTGTTVELSNDQPHLFQQAIPPRLIRRIHASDVFVTNLRVLGEDTFEVSARWPAEHCFYGPVRGQHDPLLMLETVRQAGILIAHFAYEIPREHKFITHDKQFDVVPAGFRTADGAAGGKISGETGSEAGSGTGGEAVDVVLTLTMHDIKRRGKRLAGMRTTAVVTRDGVRIGGATYRWSCVTSAVYQRLRGEYMAIDPAAVTDLEPLQPHLVNRTDDVDVMLAGTAGDKNWDLRVDTAHPVIYDHWVDHIPGYGCIEAARQAALLAIGRPDATVVAGELDFHHFLEFDAPCRVSAQQVGEADGVSTVRVTFSQKDELAVECLLDLVRS
jgi:hypothetical protein